MSLRNKSLVPMSLIKTTYQVIKTNIWKGFNKLSNPVCNESLSCFASKSILYSLVSTGSLQSQTPVEEEEDKDAYPHPTNTATKSSALHFHHHHTLAKTTNITSSIWSHWSQTPVEEDEDKDAYHHHQNVSANTAKKSSVAEFHHHQTAKTTKLASTSSCQSLIPSIEEEEYYPILESSDDSTDLLKKILKQKASKSASEPSYSSQMVSNGKSSNDSTNLPKKTWSRKLASLPASLAMLLRWSAIGMTLIFKLSQSLKKHKSKNLVSMFILKTIITLDLLFFAPRLASTNPGLQ